MLQTPHPDDQANQREVPFSPQTDTELFEIRVDSASTLNNNNNQQQLTLSGPEKRAIAAVCQGEVGVLQLLLGEALYIQLSCLEKEQNLAYHRGITKLYRAYGEALETTLLSVSQEVTFQEVGHQQALIVLPKDKAFEQLHQKLSQYFQLNSEVFKPGSVETIRQIFLKLPATTVPKTLQIKTIYQAALQKSLLLWLKVDSQQITPELMSRGRLAALYREVSQLSPLAVTASEVSVLLRLLFENWVKVQQKIVDNETTRTTLADQFLAFQDAARQAYQHLQKQWLEVPPSLFATTKETASFTLKRWKEQGCPTVHWALKNRDREEGLSLLEMGVQLREIQKEKQSHYQACVQYLVNAHLVNQHREGIQAVLLAFFENPTSDVNSAMLDTLFETVETWYRQELLLSWQHTPSLLETLAVQHAEEYRQGKRSTGQSVMDFFRRWQICEKLSAQAKMVGSFSVLSNALRGDEALAAVLFYIFRDENRITRFFHPHEKLYQQAILYREQTADGPVEKLGFVSQQRKELFQKEQALQKALENANKDKEQSDKTVETRDKTLQETSQVLNETSQALNEKSQALKETSQALKETSQALKETSQALKDAQQYIARLEQQLVLNKSTQNTQPSLTEMPVTSVNTEETQDTPRYGLQ